MDGTDQLPFGIPSFAQLYKSENDKRVLCHELVSVIDNGHNRNILVFDAPEHIPSNPNMTIEGVQRTLKWFESHNNNILPDVLFLQFDNCLRENKNAYVCAYVTLLVERGVFKFIYVCYLPVGHTHNIVDQVNSRLGEACRRVDIPFREDLLKKLHNSYTPRPHVFKMDRIADFKRLVNPELDKHFSGAAIHEHCGILEPRFFRFGKEPDGRVGFRCRKDIDDTVWSDVFYSFREKDHGIRVEDISGCDTVPIPPERLCKIRANMRAVMWRQSQLDEGVRLSNLSLVDLIANPPTDRFHWADGGRFSKEDREEHKEEIKMQELI